MGAARADVSTLGTRLHLFLFNATTKPNMALPSNPNRRNAEFDNQGPDKIKVCPAQPRDYATATGFLVLSGSMLVDRSPADHLGEWWVVSDGTATVAVGES